MGIIDLSSYFIAKTKINIVLGENRTVLEKQVRFSNF